MSGYVFNADLVDDFANKRAAIFVGSGVSASAIPLDGEPLKTWANFLKSTSDMITDAGEKKLINELIENNDHLLACELIKDIIGNQEWNDHLQSEYSRQASASDVHKKILQLKQRIIITTNFDKIIENTWTKVRGDTERYPTIKKTIDPSCFKLFRDSNNYIIKIHGCIDDAESIIFSKKDYISKAYNNHTYKQFFETLFITHTVIFIGFSMADPIISMMMDDCHFKYNSSRPHYIFLPSPIERLIETSYKTIKGLYINKYSPLDNHAELAKQLAALVEQVNERERELLAKKIIR